MHIHKTISLDLEDRRYDILVGEELLANAGDVIASRVQGKQVIIVTDEIVALHYLQSLQQTIEKAGITHHCCILPVGETTKSFTQLEVLLDNILAFQPDRSWCIIALGGGVVGDIAGFAASIILRGIDFIQIPTSLLAQVDSSVGGKTGINSRFGKNLVGSFYQPRLVISDMDVLDSLPYRQYLAGYAEIVKYGLIDRAEFFDWLCIHEDDIIKRKKTILAQAVAVSCEAKASIVEQDEREGGKRALLNLGHTFGHALERFAAYDPDVLVHGEAVAIGMCLALKLSAKLGMISSVEVNRVIEHLKSVGLPVSISEIHFIQDITVDALMQAMRHDKKTHAGKLVFILLEGIGKSFIARDIEEDAVKKMLDEELLCS